MVDEELSEGFAKSPEFLLQEENPEQEIIMEKKTLVRSDDAVKASPFSRAKKFEGFSRYLILATLWIMYFAQFSAMINHYYDNNRELVILPKFSVESVSVFPIRHDPISGTITANWNMILNVTNPSGDHELDYANLTAEIFFGKKNKINPVGLLNKFFIQPWWMPFSSSIPIWKTDFPDSGLAESRQELVKVTFPSSPVSIDNATAAALVKDIKSGVSSGFSVRLSGDVLAPTPGTFTANCPLNMAFLETVGVMASPSNEACKVSRDKSEGSKLSGAKYESLTMAGIAILHFAHFYLSAKDVDRRSRGKSAVSHAKQL
ncbi:OLC1v1000893C2 [Oldenlandia corymbosa var. corymbosa]|nr:OLC1v1000893C2 [Oldenlandia corymbosa var. corymbosa]